MPALSPSSLPPSGFAGLSSLVPRFLAHSPALDSSPGPVATIPAPPLPHRTPSTVNPSTVNPFTVNPSTATVLPSVPDRRPRENGALPPDLPMTASLRKPGLDHGAPRPVRSLRLVAQQEGQLQIHTAPFRGSFGGVFSQALRSAGLGSRVLISQFLKGGVEQGLERSLWLCGRLQWLRPDVPGCLEGAPSSEQERQAVEEVWRYSREQLLGGAVELMVLDELGLAVQLGYLAAEEVSECLERRPSHLDVILTGPSMPGELLAMADQVTQLRRGG